MNVAAHGSNLATRSITARQTSCGTLTVEPRGDGAPPDDGAAQDGIPTLALLAIVGLAAAVALGGD